MTPAASSAARLAAASALGAIAVAAFGDWPLFPLPLLALAALDWLWLRAASPRAAAALGFAFGLGHFLVGRELGVHQPARLRRPAGTDRRPRDDCLLR